jgi:hypothetical protein
MSEKKREEQQMREGGEKTMTANHLSAIKVYNWGGQTWKLWSTCGKCGACGSH